MLNEEITLEICTNLEALRECCGLRFADQVAEIEAITEAADACAVATFGQYEVDCRSHNSRSESFANLAEAEVSYEQFLDELQNCVTEGRDAWSLCLTDNGKVLRYDSFGC